MLKIIALANQKGGVAKTTSTVNLAYALSQKGKRVLTVDMDPQASLTLYCGHDPRSLERERKTIYWGLQKDGEGLASLVITGEPALLPASIQLAKAEPEFAREWDSISILRDKLRPLRDEYRVLSRLLRFCPLRISVPVELLSQWDELWKLKRLFYKGCLGTF